MTAPVTPGYAVRELVTALQELVKHADKDKA